MPTPCPACGNRLSPGLADWHQACTACGYEGSTLAPRIDAQAAGGDLDEAAREAGLEPLRRENFRRLVQRLRPLAAARGLPALLDVGCAHGWFLEACAGHFQPTGIEPDAAMHAFARARGLPVRHGYFPAALAADERFDVVSFNDVLEHIPDLAATLDACHRHLRDDGLLVVNAPCRRGVFYRLAKALARLGRRGPFERMWQKGFPSPHVHYFDTATLPRIAARHGFALVSCSTLPSVAAKGLYRRIRYSKDVPAPKAALMAAAITVASPLLAVLPADIRVWVFRRGPSGQAAPGLTA